MRLRATITTSWLQVRKARGSSPSSKLTRRAAACRSRTRSISLAGSSEAPNLRRAVQHGHRDLVQTRAVRDRRGLCARCGFLPAVNVTLCAHCTVVTALVRELVDRDLTVRDVAVQLGVHEK